MHVDKTGVSATFIEGPTAIPHIAKTLGPCQLVDSVTVPVQAAALVSAGTLTVTGGSMPVVVKPSATSSPIYSSPMGSFATGNKVTVTATGAIAPAFSIDITIPSDVTFTQPMLKDGTHVPITVSRSSDFNLKWTGGGAGAWVGIVLTTLDALGKGAEVDCKFAEDAGTGTVPTELLSYLTPTVTDAGKLGAVAAVNVGTGVSVQVGAWTIAVDADRTSITTQLIVN